MPDIQSDKTNFDRLQRHLKADSFAARLVGAYSAAPTNGQEAALSEIIKDRLAEIASGYNENK